MEATRSFSSSFLPRQSFSLSISRRRTLTKMIIKAIGEGHGRDYWGSSVDQDMIVLRKRIREMRIIENSYEDEMKSDWMEWEKQYYLHYNQDVCEAMGLLQNYLMNIRPSLALGTLVLVTFSVLISSGVVLSHALEIAKAIISAFRL